MLRSMCVCVCVCVCVGEEVVVDWGKARQEGDRDGRRCAASNFDQKSQLLVVAQASTPFERYQAPPFEDRHSSRLSLRASKHIKTAASVKMLSLRAMTTILDSFGQDDCFFVFLLPRCRSVIEKIVVTTSSDLAPAASCVPRSW